LFKRNFPSQFAESTKRCIVSTTIALVLCLTVGFVPSSLAQKSAKQGRKVLSDVKPNYPETLRSMHIEGLVRLTAVVQPNGNVLAVEVRGGNPILVENAVKAVKNWKYAPGPAQTEEEVVLNFGK
jgi:TonB family protein